MMNHVLYGIVGPTACGKTAVGVLVAERIGAEIVSADSVQIYRGMDIGSAKPDGAERRGIPHHMLDCMDIDAPSCSVAGYRDLALAAISDIRSRGKIPLLVGGSGLYINALTQLLNFAVPSDPAQRKKYESLYDASPDAAWEELEHVDPATAQRLHIHDRKRVVRALEVFACEGKPLSAYGNDFSNERDETPPVASRMFGLTLPRDELYRRINERVDVMMAAGLEREARSIWEKDYARELPAMQSIGYKQLFAYFDGNSTLENAVESIKRETRRYAKRQVTWFKRYPAIEWLDMRIGTEQAAAEIAQRIREERI